MKPKRRLTTDVHAARRAMTTSVRTGTWKPNEVHQQRLLAELAAPPGPLRGPILAALFGLGQLHVHLGPHAQEGSCETCTEPFTIVRIPTVADLQLACANVTCAAFEAAAVLVEVKPKFAPPAWSTSSRQQWVDALRTGVISVMPGAHVTLPMSSCAPHTACPRRHAHPRHAKTDGPAIPQVAPAAAIAPVVVLAENAVDASTLYDTRAWGFEIDPDRVVVQPIACGLEATLHLLYPLLRTLSHDDLDIVAYAVGGLWVRTGWSSSWPELTCQPAILRLLPSSITGLATAEVARVRAVRALS